MNDGFSWINHGDFMRFWASKQWIRSQHLYVCWGEWDLVGGLNLHLWKMNKNGVSSSVGMMKFPKNMGKSFKIPWFQSPPTRFLDGKPSKRSWRWKIFDDDFPQKKWPFFRVFSHFCWEMSVTPATPLGSLISTLSCRVTISTLKVPRFPQSFQMTEEIVGFS